MGNSAQWLKARQGASQDARPKETDQKTTMVESKGGRSLAAKKENKWAQTIPNVYPLLLTVLRLGARLLSGIRCPGNFRSPPAAPDLADLRVAHFVEVLPEVASER